MYEGGPSFVGAYGPEASATYRGKTYFDAAYLGPRPAPLSERLETRRFGRNHPREQVPANPARKPIEALDEDFMTTYATEEVTCALCSRAVTVNVLMSTNTFGSGPDLDTRPGEMMRSTMGAWVHACPGCGFVSAELGTAAPTDRAVVDSDLYQNERVAKRNELASRFVCRSLLEEAAGDLSAAGWRRLHAAWACDDAGEVEEARTQRLAALDRFERVPPQVIPKQVGAAEVLRADVARRAGDFARAEQFVAAGLALPVDVLVRGLLERESGYIAARDTGRHTLR